MEKKPAYYHNVFDGGKVRFYDFCNGCATLGQAKRLRKKCVAGFPASAKKIVDLACGTGSTTVLIGKRFRNAEIYGVDLSGEMLHYAKKKAERENVKVSFLEENIEKTSLEPRQFDVATVSFGLHEMPKSLLGKLLKESSRLLKKGGEFVFFDFHKPKSRLPRLAINTFMWYCEPQGRDFIESDIESLLQQNGFGQIKTKTFLLGAFQITSAKKERQAK